MQAVAEETLQCTGEQRIFARPFVESDFLIVFNPKAFAEVDGGEYARPAGLAGRPKSLRSPRVR